MTEPSQYFKGRTVQEQMDEVIGYVDTRAEEVAAAKAGAVLQPAEEAKTAAQAAAAAAEAAKDTTLAALPAIQQDISGLKAEDAALDGRLDTVELKVQTAEGNIVTIQGQIVALQNVQSDYVKKDGADQTVTSKIMVPTTATGLRDTQVANGTRIQNDLDAYTPMIRNTGNQTKAGILTMSAPQGLMASTTANYNNIVLESSSQSNRLISRVRNAAGDLYDQHFDLGTSYSTSSINNVSLRAFAPRAVFGDKSESQAMLSVSIHLENNDTGYVELVFAKKDGTKKVMRIGTFDGANWS